MATKRIKPESIILLAIVGMLFYYCFFKGSGGSSIDNNAIDGQMRKDHQQINRSIHDLGKQDRNPNPNSGAGN